LYHRADGWGLHPQASWDGHAGFPALLRRGSGSFEPRKDLPLRMLSLTNLGTLASAAYLLAAADLGARLSGAGTSG